MVKYENPAALQINAYKDYTYYVFVIEDNEYIRLFTYGHLSDGQWWHGPRYNPNLGKLGGPAVFQNRAKDKTIEIIVPTSRGTCQHISLNANTLQWKKGKSFGNVKLYNDDENRVAAFQNNAPNNFNYEVITREENRLQHYWYDYSADKWNKGQNFGWMVGSPAAFQNGAPDNFNYEVIVPEYKYNLQHYWYGHLSDGKWHKGEIIDSSNFHFQAPTAFQDLRINKYEYEVITSRRDLNRNLSYYKYGHLTSGKWRESLSFSYASPREFEFLAPTAFQNHAPNNYNYEVIVPLKNSYDSHCYLQHYWCDSSTGRWNRAQSFG